MGFWPNNLQPFAWMENQSHSGYLSQTVLQPQQKEWHFKGHAIEMYAFARVCVCIKNETVIDI